MYETNLRPGAPNGARVIESIVLGVTLGLFAGLIPGAFSTIVATTALERGMGPGVRVALIPLVTELPALLTSVLVLTRLPEGLLRWVGVIGGSLLLFMGWRVLRGAGHGNPIESGRMAHRGHYTRVVLFGLLAPGAWAFWFFLGGPLLLGRWRVGVGEGLLFVGAFMVCFVGAMLLLAWGVGTGRRHLGNRGHRRALRFAGGLLLVAGSVIIWQSAVGNFAEMVQAPDRVQEQVDREARGEASGPVTFPGRGS